MRAPRWSVLAVSLALVAIATPTRATQDPSGASPPSEQRRALTTVVDGAQTPEAIPDASAQRMVMMSLATAARAGAPALDARLRAMQMTGPDADVVRDEAARLLDDLTDVQRDAVHLFGTGRAAITPENAVQARALAERQVALGAEAFGRMLARLSTGGVDRVQAFVVQEKRRMTLLDPAEGR
jgi:ABC-type amino acid transport substrate-binding protein